jgi:hypothetical protein
MNPPDRTERIEKFTKLAEPVIGPRRLKQVIAAVDTLETTKDIRALTALVTIR